MKKDQVQGTVDRRMNFGRNVQTRGKKEWTWQKLRIGQKLLPVKFFYKILGQRGFELRIITS